MNIIQQKVRSFFPRLGQVLLAAVLLFALGQGMVRAQDAPSAPAIDAPDMVSYQGQVSVSGSPYTGTGYFKFVIVDQTGAETIWSNDGSSVLGGEPEKGVPLEVINGLFQVMLGDTRLDNMNSPLEARAFTESPIRYLRTWFSTDDNTYILLKPDRQIASVPYALVAEVAGDAQLLAGLSGSSYQRRVSSVCPVGQSIRAINFDGSVVCEADDHIVGECPVGQFMRGVLPDGSPNCRPDAPLLRSYWPLQNIFNTADSDPDSGWNSSITIGVDGFPIIAHTDSTGGPQRLKVTHCGNSFCSEAMAVTTLLDDPGNGLDPSIIIDAVGRAIISYGTMADARLKLAVCTNDACTTFTTRDVDNPANAVGMGSSVMISANGNPMISYIDQTAQTVKFALCNDSDCTSAAITTVPGTTGAGGRTALALGANSMPLIAYFDDVADDLYLFACSDAACTTGVKTDLHSTGNIGMNPSIVIGVDGFPIISYYDIANGDLRVVHCTDVVCAAQRDYTLIDSGGNVGSFSSITIGADSLPVISYYDTANKDLKLAHCANWACTNVMVQTIYGSSPAADAGSTNAITMNVDGSLLISFYDQTSNSLRVFRSYSQLGVPFFRRR